MNIYSIYKITNLVNGKNYIGFTSLNSKKRFNLHVSNSKHVKTKRGILSSAIIKYGRDNFVIEIIAQSKDKDYALFVLEPAFIKEYKDKGQAQYNLSLGGEGSPGRVQSVKERKMRSSLMKEISSRNDVKKKKSDAARNGWNKGIYKRGFNTSSWKVTYPNGNIDCITNLKELCKTRPIYSHTFRCMRGYKTITRGPFAGCTIEKI